MDRPDRVRLSYVFNRKTPITVWYIGILLGQSHANSCQCVRCSRRWIYIAVNQEPLPVSVIFTSELCGEAVSCVALRQLTHRMPERDNL